MSQLALPLTHGSMEDDNSYPIITLIAICVVTVLVAIVSIVPADIATLTVTTPSLALALI